MKLNNNNAIVVSSGKALLFGASAFAMCTAMSASAFAQEADVATDDNEAEEDIIIVDGIRGSLNTSQDIKRDSDTFVDVITASDITALPDRSVSEALQRVPGVSIIRFAGPNDPDHFAVEGSGVNIRGLPFVRSELNGRDVFGANSGGVLGFDDISPELLSSVVVFKNSSADLIEGGAAGTVDLRTRVPFDQNGQLIALSGELNYSDFSEEVAPTVSGLYSNNWDTGAGRFGILGNVSYSRLLSRADGTGLGDFLSDDGSGGDQITDAEGNLLFVPGGGSIRTQEFDRERLSIAAAAQWESTDGRFLATAQFLRSDSTLLWGENVVETVLDGATSSRPQLDRTDFVFGSDGVFTGGTITDNSQWRGPNATAALTNPTGGQQIATFRERLEEDITNDYGFNLKFSPNDRLKFNFDAQYIDSSAEVVDVQLVTSFFSSVFVDSSVGSVPQVSFQDPVNPFLRSFLDQTSQNDADSFALRGDVEYDFSGDGFLKSVRAGVRYNEQDSLLRQSDFNWGNISEVWTGSDINNTAVQPDGSFDFNAIESIFLTQGNTNPALNDAVAGLFGPFFFDNFQRGQSGGTGFSGPIPFYTGPGADDFDGYQAVVSNILAAVGGSPSGANVLTERPDVIAGTPFLPSEIGSISRDTIAVYARLDFGSDLSGGKLEGNVGVRFVHTDRSVDTTITIDPFTTVFPTAFQCDPGFVPPPPAPGSAPFALPSVCADLALRMAQFGDGQVINQTVDTSYTKFLPSFNVKYELDNGLLFRFAYSRTLTRPGVDQLNERVQIFALPDLQPGGPGTPNIFGGFTSNASGNAALLPQISDNFDVSAEWYFDDAGSLTITGFHKSINNFIAFSPAIVPIDFEDETLFRNTESNSDENGRVTGIEVAYQQFYDFLPGVLGGLGLQATYTFIDSQGVANTIDETLPSDDPPAARFAIDGDIFPRISRHNFNIIGLYEKYGFEGRVAFNWRSSFQLTPRDVIFPFASIFQPATGQLDASIFYNINENFKLGIQAVNLLDDITVTEQSINEESLRAPRNFFRNDRRFSLIARVKF